MRVLVLTKIFPNRVEPFSNPFNRQQFAALGKLCEVEVLATIPWFPGAGLVRKWSHAGRLVDVPERDVIDGVNVAHPRYLFLPKVGRGFTGPLYLGSMLAPVLARRRKFDVILGSWAYPDGVAAVALARLFRLPSVMKLHGSDVNVLGRMPGPRRNLAWALPRANRVVAVSRALADEAAKLGAARDRIDVVQNGVDGSLFHPADPIAARRELGLDVDGEWIVYVGRLEETKGVLDLVDAFARLARERPRARLALVGDGAARPRAEALAQPLGARVRFAGAQPLEAVPRWMAAADLVTLPSWAEGTPNVILEAQAAGRPVVASDVGGIPDLITTPLHGERVPARDPAALASALGRVLDGVAAGRHPAAELAASAGAQGWAESARKLHDVLYRAVTGAGA
jgi:glycosyltransferase involved in cell wall biosynthesis